MTEFGDLEKQMLRDMVLLHKSQNLCIYSWLSKLFDDKVSFKWVPDSHQWNYRFEINSNELGKNEILPKIKYFHFLYKRLEKTNLIDLDLCSTIEFNFKVFESHVFSLSVGTELILYEFLNIRGNKQILVSNYIIDLVDNNFKTPEQRRFELQLNDANIKHLDAMGKAQIQVKYSRLAFGASLITLLISSGLGIWTKYSETKIDQSQLSQIKHSIEQTTPPDVIKTEITNDTLTARIIEIPKAK